MILHPHPQAGGTMNDRVTQALYKTFVARGFATLRFNFRGVGRSQGSFDNGVGELSDAAAALDWVQSIHPEASPLDRRLFVRRADRHAVADAPPGDLRLHLGPPPANMYDFSFLAPCPASGIIVQGSADTVVTPNAVQKLVDKLAHAKAHHHPPRRDPARQPFL
jgi:alpha/beta superfamily hydrolase